MKRDFFAYIKKNFGTETSSINRLLVSSFLYFNNVKVIHNGFIKGYIIQEDELNFESYLKLIEYIEHKKIKFDFESLIEYFEFVISPEDKIVNGAVYTPLFIRDYIIEQAFLNKKNIEDCILGDFSCGCGCFLYNSAKKIKQMTNKTYFDIFKNQIYGLDITNYSVERTKIVLCLLALTEGEDSEFEFNIFEGNALSFDWKKESQDINVQGGFDYIFGNPPYVSAKNISNDSRNLLNKWSVSQIGNPDLYIPFFQIGLENLKYGGILGYITVNSFIRSLNGRLLREYIQALKPKMEIIDFGDEQIFEGRSTYTCICFIKKDSSNKIGYINTISKNLKDLSNIPYTLCEDLNAKKGWTLGSKNSIKIINKIESTGKPLGEIIDIRNGFATLRNSIYLFNPVSETNDYYVFEKNNIYYEVEKNICRDAIKANILRSENDIDKFKEKIIFPYEANISLQSTLFDEKQISLSTICEENFKSNYPKAYKYLLSNKLALANRDKGKKKYEQWYAYGRNQALLISGYKLLFPCYTNKPYFILTEEKDLLFYNGYAIISDNLQELEILKKILNSAIFWFYIKKTSKPYSNQYFALSKNFVRNFGICDLNDLERKILLKLENESEINSFLGKKYNIDMRKISYENEFNTTSELMI